MAEPDLADNPYPGLRPFQADETHLFFGRDAQRIELLRRLRQSRFLAIVGTSGSGKSSLVRAGLLPGLHGGFMAGRGGAAGRWRVADMRPGTDPIGNLARALDQPGVLRDQALADDQPSYTEVTLRRSGLGLVQACKEARLPEADSLLVLVDQFEELFRGIETQAHSQTQVHAADDASAFVKLLLEAVQQPTLQIYVVLTMRSDFLGDCARFRDLPEAINGGQYLIPRLTHDQIREAITGPAAVQGVTMSAPLVNRLLNDVGESPDQLPILQHALMRTWDQWHKDGHPDGELDLEDYERIGGMGEALKRHADEVLGALAQGVDAAAAGQRLRIAEQLFKALTGTSSNGQKVRRLARLGDVAELAGCSTDEVLAVAAGFRQPGNAFLMPPAGDRVTPDTYLDIAHESLIRHWRTLGGWLAEEAASAAQFLRLTDTARRHAQGRAGLWGDPDLGEALRWRQAHRPNAAWARRYRGDFVQAMDFLDDSQVLQLRREMHSQRKRRVRVTWASAALITVLGAALMWLGHDIHRAREQALRAEALKSDLQMNEPLVQLLREREAGRSPAELGPCDGVRPAGDSTPPVAPAASDASATPYNERQTPLLRRLCDPDRPPSNDDHQYLAIVDLLEKGDVAEAARRIAEQPGRIAIQANNLMFELADMKGGPLLAERRSLLELQARADAAAMSAAARRKSVASLARINGQAAFQHPVHQRIAEHLVSTEPLSGGEAWLLKAYKAQQRGKWRVEKESERLADCVLPEADQADEPAHQLEAEFYRAMCQAALRPDSQLVQVYAAVQGLASDYAWDLLLLLTWPAWLLRRWWQRRRAQPINPKPHPLRRALANLVDVMLGFFILWVVITLGETITGMLPASAEAAAGVVSLVTFVLMLALPLAYLLLADTIRFRHRRSIGKIAFDLRALRDEGGVISVADSVRRNAPLALGASVVGIGLAIWAPDGGSSNGLNYLALMAMLLLPELIARGRSWSDRWSCTQVVDADSNLSRLADAPPRYCSTDERAAAAAASAAQAAAGG